MYWTRVCGLCYLKRGVDVMKYSCVICAAGSGSRMNLGYNKMNLNFKNKPLYTYPVKKFKDLGYTDIILFVMMILIIRIARPFQAGKNE